MRSLLFVPGNSAGMMAKAVASGADVLIFDLEDAVHPDAKPAARQLVAETLDLRARRPCALRPGQRARQRLVS